MRKIQLGAIIPDQCFLSYYHLNVLTYSLKSEQYNLINSKFIVKHALHNEIYNIVSNSDATIKIFF